MVPGARETVSVDSVASGRRSAPYPPSGHRRRRGHLGPFFVPRAPLATPVAPRSGPPSSPLKGLAQRTLPNQQTRIARGKSEPGLSKRL